MFRESSENRFGFYYGCFYAGMAILTNIYFGICAFLPFSPYKERDIFSFVIFIAVTPIPMGYYLFWFNYEIGRNIGILLKV